MTESPQLAVRPFHGSVPVIWQLINTAAQQSQIWMWLRTLFSSLIAVFLHHVFLKHWSLSTKSEHQGAANGTLASDLKTPVFYRRQETDSSDTFLISSVPSHRFRKCMTKTNHNYILPELSFKSLFLLVRDYINLITSLNLIRKIESSSEEKCVCMTTGNGM